MILSSLSSLRRDGYPCSKLIDKFCNTCGKFATSSRLIASNPKFQTLFYKYFNKNMSDLDKPWVPKVVCNPCYSRLCNWGNSRCQSGFFKSTMEWRQPTAHPSDCYVCSVNLLGLNAKKSKHLIYPDVNSVTKAVEHTDRASIPPVPDAASTIAPRSDDGDDDRFVYPNDVVMEIDDSNDVDYCESDEDSAKVTSKEIQLVDQNLLDDIAKDCALSIEQIELITSRLKERNVCDSSTKTTAYRKRYEPYLEFFKVSKEGDAYCCNVKGLFEAFEFEYDRTEWRLFIDSGKDFLKAALIHNGNIWPTMPVFIAKRRVKENRESILRLLDLIRYKVDEHKWKVIADFKVILILMGMKQASCKYPCIYCLWEAQARDLHYSSTAPWPERTDDHCVDEFSVVEDALVDWADIILPPLHIKLGLVKSFIKFLFKEHGGWTHPAMAYLSKMFDGRVTDAKLKSGTLAGPEIRLLFDDEEFTAKLVGAQVDAWISLKEVCAGFLGNIRVANYREIIARMVTNFGRMSINMSLKVHMLDDHVDRFAENNGAVSDEQGERIHQDMADFLRRFQGSTLQTMLADYAWSVTRSPKWPSYKRQSRRSRKIRFFVKSD